MNRAESWVCVVLSLILLGACAAPEPAPVVEADAEAVLEEVPAEVPPLATLFTGAEQHETMDRISELVQYTVSLTASEAPYNFPVGDSIELPSSFDFDGKTRNTQALFDVTDTAAVLVLHQGAVVFENYWLTGGRDVRWLSMSVAKSFISVLVGIAIDEGHISNIEDPVTQYVPSLSGSSFDGVRIKDVLQMSSGSSWNEEYGNPESDISRLGAIPVTGEGSYTEFIGTLERENEPGTVNRYNSAETQVLTELLIQATGKRVVDYMQEKLWAPMGAESPAYWVTDSKGVEMGFAGLNATARDYAKLGEMYRNEGVLNGQQIVPREWVKASVVADGDHVQPGLDPQFPLGYGYQWWLVPGGQGDYSAIGVLNQFIYVHPGNETVIVKLSANSVYGTEETEEANRELESLAFFRAVANQLGG